MLFQYEAELDAFLEFLIWRFSIWVDKPTPGIALMNLRYRDERAVETRGKGKKVCKFLDYVVSKLAILHSSYELLLTYILMIHCYPN